MSEDYFERFKAERAAHKMRVKIFKSVFYPGKGARAWCRAVHALIASGASLDQIVDASYDAVDYGDRQHMPCVHRVVDEWRWTHGLTRDRTPLRLLPRGEAAGEWGRRLDRLSNREIAMLLGLYREPERAPGSASFDGMKEVHTPETEMEKIRREERIRRIGW